MTKIWTLFYLQRNNPCHRLIILYLNSNHFMLYALVYGIYVTDIFWSNCCMSQGCKRPPPRILCHA